ncbi:MAG: class I SAM-dependent methyltransferase [Catenulispora sp.]
MPNVPPAPHARLTENDTHSQRQVAESYGADTERYDRTRPRYPEGMIQKIIAETPGPELLDVGAGTGIAGLAFQAAGCKVLGVEPDPRMAAFARDHGLAVEVGKFEDWDAAGRTFDGVLAGMAWHWIDPAAGAAKAAEVLRPGGRLSLFWNAFQPAKDIADAFAAVYARVLPDSPIYQRGMAGAESYNGVLTRSAEGLKGTGAFAEPEQWKFGWRRDYTREEWLDQIPTFGGHGQLPPEELKALLDGIGAAIDERGGSFTMDYTAVVLTTVRSGS